MIEKFCKGKILEVGCGYGKIFKILEDYDVEATEIDKIRLNFCLNKYPVVNIYDLDIFSENFNKKYDTILLLGVLESLNVIPEEALKILKRNLNYKGVVIFEVPNVNSLVRRLKCLFGLEPVDKENFRNFQFTINRIRRFIKKAGYEIVYLNGSGRESFHGFNFWVPKFLSRNYMGVLRKVS